MTTATDYATLLTDLGSTASELTTAANAAATAEKQVAAGTPSEWASIATMYAIANAQSALGAAQKAATALGVDIAPPPPPPPPTTVPLLGFYTGSNSSAGSEALAKTLGVTAQGCSLYCDGTSYASIGGSGWAKGLADPLPMYLGVNLVPNGGDLTQVAANLAQFAELAKVFAAGDIARPGWEPDGNWFAWGYGKGGSTPPANTIPLYIAGYRAVVLEMRGANPIIRFDWCTNAGSSTLAQLQAAYPGDDVCDFIGFDHYDAGTLAANVAAVTPGIQMAAAHDKPLSIGEWGPGPNDDPAFIDFMAQLILDPAAFSAAHGLPTYSVGYTSVFTDSSNNITDKPLSIAEFAKAFG